MKIKNKLIVLSALLLLAVLTVTQASAFGLTRTVTSSVDTTYGSRYSDNAADWFEDGVMPASAAEIPTDYVMPDYSNTGYVSAYEDLVDFGVKYPLVPKKSAGSGGWTYTINSTTAALYNYCFEGFKIEHGSISFDEGGEKVLMTVNNPTNSIVLRDFYINAMADISTCVFTRRLADQTRVVLLDGEFVGSTSSQVTGFNITMKRCFLHQCQADHVKGFSGQYFVGCYFCDGGLNGGNPHPDCVQFTVDDGHGNGLSTDHVYYFGNRFDAMLTKINTTNSCIIMQSEFGGGISDVHINYNWFNGGGVAVQIGAKDNKNVGGPEYHTDVEFCYNYFGHGEKWEENYKFTARGSTLPKIQAVEKNTSTAGTTRATDLDVGSIVYTAGGRQVRTLSGLSGSDKQVTVTVANYNFRSIRAVCSVVVYNAAGERQTTSVKTFDIPGYVPYATYSGNASMWQTFRYGD
ncbi:MAG: hypothetical protein J6125_04810, partial [Clostridia bacterium]|nr:hypothetical protein [Clostridia bacterium]